MCEQEGGDGGPSAVGGGYVKQVKDMKGGLSKEALEDEENLKKLTDVLSRRTAVCSQTHECVGGRDM